MRPASAVLPAIRLVLPPRVRERNVGAIINEPEAIAARLAQWQDEKQKKGVLPLLPASVRDGLSRADQFAGVEKFLASIVAQKP